MEAKDLVLQIEPNANSNSGNCRQQRGSRSTLARAYVLLGLRKRMKPGKDIEV